MNIKLIRAGLKTFKGSLGGGGGGGGVDSIESQGILIKSRSLNNYLKSLS